MKAVILGWKREYLTKYLDDCEKICYNLAKKNYTIVTGGGDGFMMAANKGAFECNKTKSIGISVESIVNIERNKNHYYLNDNFHVAKNFAERKFELYKDADLIVFFPGGMGTLDEFTEILNLMKTNEYKKVPIILHGKKYWTSLIKWFGENGIKFPNHLISKITDDIDDYKNL